MVLNLDPRLNINFARMFANQSGESIHGRRHKKSNLQRYFLRLWWQGSWAQKGCLLEQQTDRICECRGVEQVGFFCGEWSEDI